MAERPPGGGPPAADRVGAVPDADDGGLNPATLLRLGVVLVCLCVSEFVIPPWGDQWPRLALLGLALLLSPVDVLPAILVLTVRNGTTVIGALCVGDVIGLVYLARLSLTERLAGVRVTPSRVALLAFLAWATVVTVTGVGLLTAIARIALYAAVGMAATYRDRGRRCLYIGVVGFAVTEVVLHLPELPARLWGHFIGDPAQTGALLVAALVIVLGSRLPRPVKLALAATLLAGVAMTLTRSVWFATGVVAAGWLLPRRWYLPILLPHVAAVVALPLVPGITRLFRLNESSAEVRHVSIESGLREFAERPVTGHGWAFGSALHDGGLVGFAGKPIYNLWIFIGVSVGLVGIALFLAFIVSLSREVVHDVVAYHYLAALLAMSLTEMPLYGLSLPGVLFFLLTPGRAGPRHSGPRHSGPRHSGPRHTGPRHSGPWRPPRAEPVSLR